MSLCRVIGIELFDERAARMSKLLRMSAPRAVIAVEARLMVRAADGGPARHIWAEICDLVGSYCRYYVAVTISHALCRLNIWHFGEHDDFGIGCVWCGRGMDPIMRQSLDEEEN